MKLLLTILPTLFLSSHLRSQTGGSYDLSWSSIDNGGGASSGGNYKLTGTIGQPDAGNLSGGNYRIVGGFITEIILAEPIIGLLRIDPAAGSPGHAVLSWPVEVTGFVLETSPDLTPGSWTPEATSVVDDATHHTVTVPALGKRFFRLRR